MASVVIGDNTVSFYNWAGYMDSRECDFLSAAASQGFILPAFTSSNPAIPAQGYNVVSKFGQVSSYLLDGEEPISARLDAAEQLVQYIDACYSSAVNRRSYFQGGNMDDIRDQCDWSQNYFNDSSAAALDVRQAVGSLRGSAVSMRDTLQAAQNQEIDEAEVQVQLNGQIAELNDKIAKTQQSQDAAKVTAFIKDVLVYVIPVIAAVLLYFAFRKKQG